MGRFHYWISLVGLLAILALICTPALAVEKQDEDTAKATKTDKADKATKTGKDDKADVSEDDDSLFPKKTKKDDKKTDKKKDDQEGDTKEGKIHPDLVEMYAEVADVVELDEQGQEKLLKLQKRKAKALDAFDKKYDPRIVKIENAMDRTEKKKRLEKLRAELKKIHHGRKKLEFKYDNKIFSILNKDQMVTWNRYELWTVLSPEFEFDDEELEFTDEQVEKAKGICQAVAKKMGTKKRIAKNPKIQRMTRARIGKTVLNKKQRIVYARQQRRKRLEEKEENKHRKRD